LRFSIIVPVYNVESYLEECLQSIFCQSYDGYEVILVDDGSTDSSGIICDQMQAINKNKRIKVIHKQNGGLSDARNVGLQVAMGEYVVFVDSDDLITKDALKSFEKAIVQADYPEVIITRLIERCENIPDKSVDAGLHFCRLKDNDKIVQHLCNASKSFCFAQRYIVKRKLISEKKLSFRRGFYHEDLDWTTNLLIKAKTYTDLQQPWYIYRMDREGSITNSPSKGFKRITDVLTIAKEDVKCVESSDLSKRTKKVLCKRINASVFSILSLYNSCDIEGKRKIENELNTCRSVFRYTSHLSHFLFVGFSSIFGFRLGFLVKNLLHNV
jgi:glycosyltransferase involved in cell wall biosynthesis